MQPISIEDIRIKFPNPSKSAMGEYDENAYCVGGAFMQSVGKHIRFPFPTQMSHWVAEYRFLMELPEIERVQLLMGCSEVIRQNDLGRFDTAWHLLGDLIS